LASEKLLLVDDDDTLRSGLGVVLGASGFEVTSAAGVAEALRYIAAQPFDVLLTDLHMPGPGDGLTVVSAMRHTHPESMTLLLSADPNLVKASAAIVSQVDEVILKPVKASLLVQRIRERLDERLHGQHPPTPVEAFASPARVADVIELEGARISQNWLAELERPAIKAVPQVDLSAEERTEHLAEALRDILFRLRYPQVVGASTLFSISALQHGARRRRQGIGAATLAEEARALQVAIFRIVQAQRERFDPGELVEALIAIADEVNAQLLQALQGFENEDPPEPQWGFR
jgi:DNA-binding response OmpR family regulator